MTPTFPRNFGKKRKSFFFLQNANKQLIDNIFHIFIATVTESSSSISLVPITALSTLATSTTPTPPTPPVRPTRPSRPSKPSHHPIKWPNNFHQKLKPIDEAEDKIDVQKNKNKKKPPSSHSHHLINTKPPKDPRPNLPTR